MFSMLDFMNRFLSKFINLESRIPTFWFMNRVFQIVDKRKEEGVRKRDYLQLLIDAEGEISKDDKITSEKDFSNAYIQKKMTVDVNKIVF